MTGARVRRRILDDVRMALDAEGALAGVAGLVSICIGNTPAVDVDVYGAIRRVAPSKSDCALMRRSGRMISRKRSARHVILAMNDV